MNEMHERTLWPDSRNYQNVKLPVPWTHMLFLSRQLPGKEKWLKITEDLPEMNQLCSPFATSFSVQTHVKTLLCILRKGISNELNFVTYI